MLFVGITTIRHKFCWKMDLLGWTPESEHLLVSFVEELYGLSARLSLPYCAFPQQRELACPLWPSAYSPFKGGNTALPIQKVLGKFQEGEESH